MEHTNLVLKRIWYRVNPHFLSCKKIAKDLVSLPLFLIPLFLKVVVSFFVASHFATELFIPFVHYFVYQGGENPYDYFYTSGELKSFPYPSVMLWILSVPYLLASSAHSLLQHSDLLLLRLPLLFADIGILMILISWFKKWSREILVLYWCSPILFYITYIHGQLDVIPIFILFCSLYLLFKEQDLLAFIFLGLAISTKTGMVVVLPFIILYIIKERKRISTTISSIVTPFLIFGIVNSAYLFKQSFITMVLKTKEQFKVFDLVLSYNQNLLIYVVPVAYLVLLLKFSTFKKYSRDLLMVFLGFSFFILTLCIPPMQGWYYWIIPFAVYFYAKETSNQIYLYYSITLAYFFYFAVIPQSDFFTVFEPTFKTFSTIKNFYVQGKELGIPVDFIVNTAFSILQAVLLVNIFWIYRKGIEQYTRYKMHYKPFLIGIAGDSGSGKSTLAQLISDVFISRNVSLIAGDDMHKWERGNEMWTKYTHLDPLANDLHADIKNIYDLKKGESFFRRNYDHQTGKFSEPKLYEAKRLVIFEGLHTFFLDKVRKAFDLKIYVAPEDQLRLHWKIIRDSNDRGYTKEQIVDILDKRKDDSERFITVQEKHSDVIISLRNNTSLGKNLGEENTVLSLSLFITCANDIFLEPLLDELSPYFSIDYLIADHKQRVKFTGDISSILVEEIAEKLLSELDDFSQETRKWHSGYQGVIQLFVTFYMFQLMAHEHYDNQ